MASRFIAEISGAFSALLTAAAVVVASPAGASPPLSPFPAITPGAGLALVTPAGNSDGVCTAGWLAHDRSGHPVMLSAGHCDHGRSSAAMKWTGTGKYEVIGAFVQSVHPEADPGGADFGVIALSSQIPSDARVLDRRPVEGVTAGVHVGDLLCKYGNTTGRSCGRVLDKPTDDKVQFDTESREGDSGGPVYLIQPNGDAVAVGIDVGHTDTGRAVAEMVQPWLHKLGLTLDTTAGGTAQPARYGR
jgi:hypothetical protein